MRFLLSLLLLLTETIFNFWAALSLRLKILPFLSSKTTSSSSFSCGSTSRSGSVNQSVRSIVRSSPLNRAWGLSSSGGALSAAVGFCRARNDSSAEVRWGASLTLATEITTACSTYNPALSLARTTKRLSPTSSGPAVPLRVPVAASSLTQSGMSAPVSIACREKLSCSFGSTRRSGSLNAPGGIRYVKLSP